jgi:type I restriction enzyme R subunit
MSAIGAAEKRTQRRVAKLFVDELGYEHLGDLSDADNRNIIEAQLEHFLWSYQGYSDREDGEDLVRRAIAEVVKVAGNTSLSLYDRNRNVYELLRYGVKVKADVGAQTETVWLIDWEHPERNRFAIAEEVTVKAADAKAATKRPDIVLYVNGIALGVLELKRSSVSVSEGIRQNLDNQKKEFIQPFFSTMQYVMAGNDTEGLRYGTIQTPEKYYLTWKEAGPGDNPLDKGLRQLCAKARFLELVHDFVVFDAGTKKLCRHNQYFGVRAAQGASGAARAACCGTPRARQEPDHGVARQVDPREHDGRPGPHHHRPHRAGRADREGLQGVAEDIYRTKSGAT